MTLDQLHSELKRRNIALQMDGYKLIAVDPHQRLSPTLDAGIRQYRDEIISNLKAVSVPFRRFQEIIGNTLVATDLEPIVGEIDKAYQCGDLTQAEAENLARAVVDRSRQIPKRIEDMPLKDFAKSGLVRKVQSKVLGETVLWAADNAEVPSGYELVVYCVAELKELVGQSPEMLRRIHVAKKELDGEVVAGSNNNTCRVCVDELSDRPES